MTKLELIGATRYKEEGHALPDVFDELEDLVSESGTNYFVHFSDINKLGINPKTMQSYSTPGGIYSYPLTSAVVATLRDGHQGADFAMDRKYIHVFKSSGKVLDVGDKGYDKAELQRDLRRVKNDYLKRLHKRTPPRQRSKLFRNRDALNTQLNKLIANAREDANSPDMRDTPPGGSITDSYADETRPIDELWNVTRMLSRNPIEWASMLRNLGFDGISDLEGYGRIHQAEPEQAVFFNKGVIDHVATFDNPYAGELPSSVPSEPTDLAEWYDAIKDPELTPRKALRLWLDRPIGWQGYYFGAVSRIIPLFEAMTDDGRIEAAESVAAESPDWLESLVTGSAEIGRTGGEKWHRWLLQQFPSLAVGQLSPHAKPEMLEEHYGLENYEVQNRKLLSTISVTAVYRLIRQAYQNEELIYTEYGSPDEWLARSGSDEVALVIDNSAEYQPAVQALTNNGQIALSHVIDSIGKGTLAP